MSIADVPNKYKLHPEMDDTSHGKIQLYIKNDGIIHSLTKS